MRWSTGSRSPGFRCCFIVYCLGPLPITVHYNSGNRLPPCFKFVLVNVRLSSYWVVLLISLASFVLLMSRCLLLVSALWACSSGQLYPLVMESRRDNSGWAWAQEQLAWSRVYYMRTKCPKWKPATHNGGNLQVSYLFSLLYWQGNRFNWPWLAGLSQQGQAVGLCAGCLRPWWSLSATR